MNELAEFVRQAALAEGFALAGIAPAAPVRELDYFPAWIAAGYHGEMEYLARANEAGQLRRAALANVAPWARSVIVCAANYNSDAPYSTECADPTRGWISRYAFVAGDYHEVLLARLRRMLAPGGRTFVTTPVNAPTVDHIYLFHHTQEIRDMLGSEGFVIESEVTRYAEDMPDAQAAKLKVPQMFAAFLRVAET